MTFAELQRVVLVVILAHWKVPPDQTADGLKLLLQIVSSLPFKQEPLDDRWIEMITTPILSYFQDEESGTIPISLGRRLPGFIPSPHNGPGRPSFGLTNMAGIFPLIKSAEFRVEFLRRLAQRVGWLQDTEAWVAFRLDDTDSDLDDTESDLDDTDSDLDDTDGDLDDTASDLDDADSDLNDSCRSHVDEPNKADHSTVINDWCFATEFPSDSSRGGSRPRQHRRWVPHWLAAAKRRISIHSEEVLYLTETNPIICRNHDSITSIQTPQEQKEFDFLFSDPNSAGVFVLRNNTFEAGRTGPTITRDDVRWRLQYDMLSQQQLRLHILNKESPIIQSIFLLTYASFLYSSLSRQSATISPRVFSAPFHITIISKHTKSWVESPAVFTISYQDTSTIHYNLALVAYFKLGLDVVRGSMKGVLGMSIDD
ncbi:hypothetical protein B0H63DRAFT_136579 [Podospora didyma]|uniref:Uncharacterized protein n=1 Tax=Podospora didyma TaxID=330526 RepID=A0AAE0NRR7_9PEZI|nr:hypothetical protein B0H63DRAFT_136579 [Podospora didyma]